jgi:hypothetical protein
MSSLAAAQADGFYHPPEWNPRKESRKKFGNHKGHNQYEQSGVIRFELPLDGWCEGCGRHYGKGTRFNAKKEHDGNYFSTKIWKFTMTCPSCPQVLVIATDPKNTTYEYRSGVRKKEEDFDAADLHAVEGGDGGGSEYGGDQRSGHAGLQAQLDAIYKVGGHAGEEEREDRRTHAMRRLEHDNDAKRRAATEGERVDAIYARNDAAKRFDADANAALRAGIKGGRAKPGGGVAATVLGSRERRRAAERLERERGGGKFQLPDGFELGDATADDYALAARAFASRGGGDGNSSSSSSSSSETTIVRKKKKRSPAAIAAAVPELARAAKALQRRQKEVGGYIGELHREHSRNPRTGSSTSWAGAGEDDMGAMPHIAAKKRRVGVAAVAQKEAASDAAITETKVDRGGAEDEDEDEDGDTDNPLAALSAMYSDSDSDSDSTPPDKGGVRGIGEID